MELWERAIFSTATFISHVEWEQFQPHRHVDVAAPAATASSESPLLQIPEKPVCETSGDTQSSAPREGNTAGSQLTLPHIFAFNMQYPTLAVSAIQVL